EKNSGARLRNDRVHKGNEEGRRGRARKIEVPAFRGLALRADPAAEKIVGCVKQIGRKHERDALIAEIPIVAIARHGKAESESWRGLKQPKIKMAAVIRGANRQRSS